MTKQIKILISDTGGGHRASANSLKSALNILYPESLPLDNIEIVDLFVVHSPKISPFVNAPAAYKFLAAYPDLLWKNVYELGEIPAVQKFNDCLTYTVCNEGWRRGLSYMGDGKTTDMKEAIRPDLIISCHPLTNAVPLAILSESSATKDIPFVTICTDLNSAHSTWFNKKCDKIFVPTQKLADKATETCPSEKVKVVGLPIRQGFWNLDDDPNTTRSTQRANALKALNLPEDKRLAVIVGGGDGMGRVADCATTIGSLVANPDLNAQLVVICGSNQKLKEDLEKKFKSDSNVIVKGFVSDMDVHMLAASILITKAGPGTLAEAAACGTPTICTSFLPGQEEGNVDLVVEGGWGEFCSDGDPGKLGKVVEDWLSRGKGFLENMELNAKKDGRAKATLDLGGEIGGILNL